MNPEIEIKKAKLLEGKYMQLEYAELIEKDDQMVTVDITKKSQHEAHEDLKNCYDKFIPHLALLTEFVDEHYVRDRTWDNDEDPNSVHHQEAFRSFAVTSISVGGTGEHEGITITGRKNLKNGKVVNLNAPFTKFDEEVEDYPYVHELYVAFVDWSHEVKAYIDGKYAPSKQLELFDNNDDKIHLPPREVNASFDKDGKLEQVEIVELKKI